jgi:K(+)-stimulated pyrophosphate-energized sodium pump
MPLQKDPVCRFLWWLGPIAALIALGFAFYLYRQLMGLSEGTSECRKLPRLCAKGAMAYLRRQYKVVA